MPRIIAIANRKGGVGKTTTTVNVATAMAAAGKKVLVVDLDPQGNATTSMGINKSGRMASSYEVLLGEKRISEAVVWTEIPNFSLVPSSPDLAGAEVELVEIENREFALKKALFKDAVNYDYILIDCMPSLGMLTINAVAAADSILIPVQAAYLPVKGLEQLIKTIGKVKRQINPRLEIEGILMTMVDSRTTYARDISKLLIENYGSRVRIFNSSIPMSVRAAEISAEGTSIYKHDPNGKVAKAYQSLTEEVLGNE